MIYKCRKDNRRRKRVNVLITCNTPNQSPPSKPTPHLSRDHAHLTSTHQVPYLLKKTPSTHTNPSLLTNTINLRPYIHRKSVRWPSYLIDSKKAESKLGSTPLLETKSSAPSYVQRNPGLGDPCGSPSFGKSMCDEGSTSGWGGCTTELAGFQWNRGIGMGELHAVAIRQAAALRKGRMVAAEVGMKSRCGLGRDYQVSWLDWDSRDSQKGWGPSIACASVE